MFQISSLTPISNLSRDLLVGNDDDDLVPVLPPDAVAGEEPLLEGLDRPPDLVRARSRLNEEDLPALDDQLAVEAAEPGNVGVDVVNQADLEDGV